MLIFLTLTIMFVVGVFIIITTKSDDLVAAGFIIAALAGTFLFISLTTLPFRICVVNAEIKQFQITKTTYENVRKDIDEAPFHIAIENAAIQVDIAKQNRWLAKYQYWNNTVFDIWVPDEVMDLKPLE